MPIILDPYFKECNICKSKFPRVIHNTKYVQLCQDCDPKPDEVMYKPTRGIKNIIDILNTPNHSKYTFIKDKSRYVMIARTTGICVADISINPNIKCSIGYNGSLTIPTPVNSKIGVLYLLALKHHRLLCTDIKRLIIEFARSPDNVIIKCSYPNYYNYIRSVNNMWRLHNTCVYLWYTI